LSKNTINDRIPILQRRTGWIVGGAVSLLLALLILRVAMIQGWWRTVRIAGGSMADAFYGPHLLVTCRECGFGFRCGLEYPPVQDLAVCPNCGCRDNPVDATGVVSGQRVCIDRWAKLVHGLDTWQAVAFRSPPDSDQLTVKRIVAGGPGRVEIRDGDVYFNGAIQQKNLAQLRELRILVHDDNYRSPLANRWQPIHATSRWKPTPTGYVTASASEDAPSIDWLDYVQWACWPNSSPAISRTQRVPIFDDDSYNQSLSRGNLHPVADIMLACQLQLDRRGTCVLRVTSRADEFAWELRPAEHACHLWWNGTLVARAAYSGGASPLAVELAVCDHRVLAAIDGATVFEFDYRPSIGLAEGTLAKPVEHLGRMHGCPAAHDQPQLSVGTSGGLVHFESPRVYRDVYYGGPGGAIRWEAPQFVAASQWFVLGDNVPVSLDSRLWAAIDGRTILGPVRPWLP
jgi:signal peptidase I